MRNILFILILILLYFYSINISSLYFNFFSFFLLLIISIHILRKEGGYIFIIYIFSLFFISISGIIIEWLNIYLVEVRQETFLTGAVARNTLLSSIFLLVSYIVFSKCKNLRCGELTLIKKLDKILNRTMLIYIIFTIIVIISIFIIYGVPLANHMDRFDYALIVPKIYTVLYASIPLFGFSIAMAYYKKILKFRTIVFLYSFLLIVYILSGEKFSGIILLLYLSFLPYFIINNKSIRFKELLLFFLMGILILSLVLLNYFLIKNSSIDLFLVRFSLQGQMNYTLDSITNLDMKDINSIIKYFFGFNTNSDERGIYYLMSLVTPSDVFRAYFNRGVTFTAPFPSYSSYFFGFYMSPFIILILSIIVGFFNGIMYGAINKKNFIFALIVLKISIFLYVAILMGKIYWIFSLKFMFYFIIFLGYILVYKLFTTKRKVYYSKRGKIDF